MDRNEEWGEGVIACSATERVGERTVDFGQAWDNEAEPIKTGSIKIECAV